MLLKEESHPRLLAKKLGVNHMTVSRRLKQLLKANVVDYSESGKNKTYYLKKTVEARNHVYMSEHYKREKLLEHYPHLRRIIEKIQDNPKVKVAVLYGSHAKNTATEKSDIDVYVETKNRKLKSEIESIDGRLSVKIGEYKTDNPLAREIKKDHVIIKGVEEYYEKTRFFK
jgi:predicted nucleotidyltransferase